MTKRSWVVGAMAATLMTAALASPAAAAPTGAKNADILEIDCGALGTFDVAAAPGQGQWTPAMATDNSITLVPFSFQFDVEVWFDGTKGPEAPDVVDSETVSKHQPPRNGRMATCTFSEEGVDPEDGVYFAFTGTVGVTYQPAG